MNNLKFLKIFGFLAIAAIAFCLSILLVQPSDATSAKYDNLIAQGLVDAVKTPQELGLNYLSQQPVQLAYDNELLNSIYTAQEEVSVLPEDIPLKFDLGTNSPIEIGALPDGGALNHNYYEAVGYLDRSGKGKTFNSSLLKYMFTVEARNGGSLAITPEAQQILIADASGTFLQALRIPVFDLVVHSKRTNQNFVLENVNANAVCRDALNATLNRELKKNT
jgi:hypothetical protein